MILIDVQYVSYAVLQQYEGLPSTVVVNNFTS